jgi:hypothetical protein
MTMTSEATRPITQDEIDAYQRDGATVLRGIMPIEWVDLVREGIEEISQDPGPYADLFTSEVGWRVLLSNMAGPRNPKIWRYITESPASTIAGSVHRATELYYFLDQVFYKTAGPVQPSTWHQDTPYFNATGLDTVRAWLACDPAPRETAIEVVAGSHRWGTTFQTRPTDIDEGSGIDNSSGGAFSVSQIAIDREATPLPDIQANRDAYKILGWDVEPGDLVVFHGHILHQAGGSAFQPLPRRVLAVMYAGADERFVRRGDNAIPDMSVVKGADIAGGARFGDYPDVYPRTWNVDPAA